MTDNEIVKALEKALTDVDAPIGEHWGCGFLTTKTIKDTLDLINRQKAEIERLEKNSILRGLRVVNKERNNIKAEVIKDFAEEVEKRCVAGGIYPAFVRATIKRVKEEMTEGDDI